MTTSKQIGVDALYPKSIVLPIQLQGYTKTRLVFEEVLSMRIECKFLLQSFKKPTGREMDSRTKAEWN